MIALALLLAAASEQAAKKPPQMIYNCGGHFDSLDGGRIRINSYKTFDTAGGVSSMSVNAEFEGADFVRRGDPRDQAYVSVAWPGNQFWGPDPKRFDWARGAIKINYFPAAQNAFQRNKNEWWNQTVVDRAGSAMVYTDKKGTRYLIGSGLDLFLTNDPARSMTGLIMSVDNLIAWGTGVDAVTVYNLAVAHRKSPDKRDLPIGAKRIVASYGIDTRALAAAVAKVRAAVTAWEATIADYKTACKLEVAPSDDDIVIT